MSDQSQKRSLDESSESPNKRVCEESPTQKTLLPGQLSGINKFLSRYNNPDKNIYTIEYLKKNNLRLGFLLHPVNKNTLIAGVFDSDGNCISMKIDEDRAKKGSSPFYKVTLVAPAGSVVTFGLIKNEFQKEMENDKHELMKKNMSVSVQEITDKESLYYTDEMKEYFDVIEEWQREYVRSMVRYRKDLTDLKVYSKLSDEQLLEEVEKEFKRVKNPMFHPFLKTAKEEDAEKYKIHRQLQKSIHYLTDKSKFNPKANFSPEDPRPLEAFKTAGYDVSVFENAIENSDFAIKLGVPQFHDFRTGKRIYDIQHLKHFAGVVLFSFSSSVIPDEGVRTLIKWVDKISVILAEEKQKSDENLPSMEMVMDAASMPPLPVGEDD